MDLTEVKQFEFEQQVGKLKLSEAIRLGAKLRPQCKHAAFSMGGSCALGAAWEGATGTTDGLHDLALIEKFGVDSTTLNTIVLMNDRLGLTREQIADSLAAQGL